ncbi:hypothetical protein SprV_0100297200 [Sparganum proliferum]
MDQNPQHSRYFEAAAVTLERPSSEDGRHTSTESNIPGDVAASTRRPGEHKRRYKDTLKDTLKWLHFNLLIWEDLAQNRPAWRGEIKTSTDMYEADRNASTKAKRDAGKSQVPRLLNVNNQSPPTCSRCQRSFRARIGPVGHLPIQCDNSTATSITPTPATNHRPPPPSPPITLPLPSPQLTTDTIHPALTTATNSTTLTTPSRTPSSGGATSDVPSPSTITTTPTFRDVDSIHTCPHCGRTFTSHIDLVGHLDSVAQRLVNHCLEHPPTLAAFASAVHIAPAHSLTAWAC